MDAMYEKRLQHLKELGVIETEADLSPDSAQLFRAMADVEFEAILSLRRKMDEKQRMQFDRNIMDSF